MRCLGKRLMDMQLFDLFAFSGSLLFVRIAIANHEDVLCTTKQCSQNQQQGREQVATRQVKASLEACGATIANNGWQWRHAFGGVARCRISLIRKVGVAAIAIGRQVLEWTKIAEYTDLRRQGPR
jgi:hypothetical protein